MLSLFKNEIDEIITKAQILPPNFDYITHYYTITSEFVKLYRKPHNEPNTHQIDDWILFSVGLYSFLDTYSDSGSFKKRSKIAKLKKRTLKIEKNLRIMLSTHSIEKQLKYNLLDSIHYFYLASRRDAPDYETLIRKADYDRRVMWHQSGVYVLIQTNKLKRLTKKVVVHNKITFNEIESFYKKLKSSCITLDMKALKDVEDAINEIAIYELLDREKEG